MFESLLETLKSYSLVGPVLVAAPITLFVAFYFSWWRNRKSLSYEVLTSTKLFSVNSDVKHRIKITLDGKPAKDVQIVIIEILNDGYLPIEDKDFSTPLTIDFGESAEIISVELKEKVPEDLPVSIDFEKTKINIDPLLLNRKDSFQLQILANELKNSLKVAGRIKGVSEIKNKNLPKNFFQYIWLNIKRSFLLFSTSLLGVIIGILVNIYSFNSKVEVVVYSIIIIALFTTMILFVYKDYTKYRTRKRA